MFDENTHEASFVQKCYYTCIKMICFLSLLSDNTRTPDTTSVLPHLGKAREADAEPGTIRGAYGFHTNRTNDKRIPPQDLGQRLAPHLQESAKKAFIEHASSLVVAPGRQCAQARTLLQADGHTVELAKATSAGYTIDMVLVCEASGKTLRIAVEIDGPGRFLQGACSRPPPCEWVLFASCFHYDSAPRAQMMMNSASRGMNLCESYPRV
jgi:nucleoside diphosphate kinase